MGDAFLIQNIKSGLLGTEGNAAPSALAIIQAGTSSGDGVYWIEVDGQPREVYCDMTSDGGGWMLFATKVSFNFHVVRNTVQSNHMTNTTINSFGNIPSSFRPLWNEVLLRFSSQPYQIKYARNSDAYSGSQTNLKSWFETGSPEISAFNSNGWFRSTNNGTSFGSNTFISELYTNTSGGLSENHSNSDLIVDLWSSTDSSNNYIFNDGANGRGTKCIAGYCYLNVPVWYMFR